MFPHRFILSFAIEFGPLVLFFSIAELYNFFAGTAALIVSTVLAVTVSLIKDKRLPIFSILSTSFVLIFGTLTLFFRDPMWLALEYTLYNGFYAVMILSGLFTGKLVLKSLFGTMFAITDRGWRILSIRWGLFFLATAICNEIIWQFFSEHAWLLFRFSSAVIMCIFGFSQLRLSKRERLPEANEWGLRT